VTLDELLGNAQRIVRDVGTIAREGFGRSPIVRCKEGNDIVTRADLEIEDYVLSSLRALYPHHGFDSEEAGEQRADAEYVWILDPIDGTKYYARGVPLYSISLALRKQETLILGVVYSPETQQMFSAALEKGARVIDGANDREIECSHTTQLDQATVCVEIPSRDALPGERHWAMQKMRDLVDSVPRVRLLGVGALSLCYCAMGGFDAYVNLGSGTRLYDMAAGQAVLQEAGGQFRQIRAKIVAGPPRLCEQLLEFLGLDER